MAKFHILTWPELIRTIQAQPGKILNLTISPELPHISVYYDGDIVITRNDGEVEKFPINTHVLDLVRRFPFTSVNQAR